MSPPALTVVVPSVNGWADLEGCLATLEAERAATALEVLVVDRCGDDLRARVARRFPWATVVPAAPESSIPELRAIAFDRAAADTVAVIEDHVQVPPGWAREIVAARRRAAVVGGAVRNGAGERLIDRAAFYGEYAHLMPPLAAGAAASVAGNHVAYDRALLAAHRETYRAGRWEDHLHAAIRAAGVPLAVEPRLVVAHCQRSTLGGYVAQRYHFARSFAAGRAAAFTSPRRAVVGLAACGLVPPLVLARTLGRLAAKGVGAAEIARCLAPLALFAVVTGVGEAIGTWLGAGRSLARVR